MILLKSWQSEMFVEMRRKCHRRYFSSIQNLQNSAHFRLRYRLLLPPYVFNRIKNEWISFFGVVMERLQKLKRHNHLVLMLSFRWLRVVTSSVTEHCVTTGMASQKRTTIAYWTLSVSFSVTKINFVADDKCGFRLFDVHVSHARASTLSKL